jgi:membrane-associated phospholipid phosphatase
MGESKEDMHSSNSSSTAAIKATVTSRFLRLVGILSIRETLLWSIPIFYFVVLLITYFGYGMIFNFTLGIVFLTVIPVIAYVSKSNEFLRNTAFCITLLLSYEALQGITGTLVNVGNVIYLDAIDRMMFGLDFTATVQNALASPAVTIISTVFYGLHIYLVIIAMILFWFIDRKVYQGYTYSMILTSYLALVTFAILPSAPPWFTGAANNLLTDGFKMLPNPINMIQQLLLSIESDKLAAFPSLHAAYAMLFSVYTIKLNPRIGSLSIPILIGVLFSTIYLGQHYVIDLIAGIAYSLVTIFIVERLIARGAKYNKKK